MRDVLLCIAVGLLPRIALAYHFEDGLRGSTQGHQLGGELQADGWHVTSVSDRIWYAMPPLIQGSIEFTLAGVSNDRFVNADHEMFTIYEGGYGLQEPIDYGQLKRSHYRVMWRLRGEVAGVDNETVTHQGEQKLIWIMCPDGAPGYNPDYPTTFCTCANWIDEGPSNGDMLWTGQPERIRIEWDDSHARYFRNGTLVTTIDWSGTGLHFTPSEPHVVLGSPRSGAVSYAVTQVGAVYSDLVIDGVEGTTAVCPGSEPPPPIDPVDAGPLPANVLGVLEDATAASWETGVYSDVSDLTAEGVSASEGAVAYLKFPSTGPIDRAILKLHTLASDGAGGDSGRVCRVDDDTWSESTITWANRPAVGSTCVGTSRPVGADEDVDVDVTALIAGSGNVNLAIIPGGANAVHYASKETGRGPRLEVTPSTEELPDAAMQPPVELPDAAMDPPVEHPDAGTGAEARDGGHVVQMGTSSSEAPSTTSPSGERTCACAAVRGDAPALALLLLLVARRQRKTPSPRR